MLVSQTCVFHSHTISLRIGHFNSGRLKSLFHFFFFHYDFTDFNTEKELAVLVETKKKKKLFYQDQCIDKKWKRVEFHSFF